MIRNALLHTLRMARGEPRAGLRRKILRSLPTFIAVTLLSFALEYLGLFSGFESWAFDSISRFFNTWNGRFADDLVIVAIDDQDYAKIFGGTSPIDGKELQDLLDAIEKGQPRVIGVDLDTSSPAFANVGSPRAIWARDARPDCGTASAANGRHEPCESEDIVRLGACGGTLRDVPIKTKEGTHIRTDPPSGVIVFPQDHDGVVRRYRRTFRSSAADDSPHSTLGNVDSLPWAVVKHYRSRAGGNFSAAREADPDPENPLYADDEQELRLNFAGDNYRFRVIPARAVLEAQNQDYWKDKSPLKDAVVLVGGTYREARDDYVTPVGQLFGVQLIAQAVESDLHNGGIRELNWILAILMDAVASCVLIFLNWRFPGPKLVWLNLIAIVALSMLGSLVAFRTIAYWFNFIAVLAGIWIHMIWEHAAEHQAMKRELEAYRRGEHPPHATHG